MKNGSKMHRRPQGCSNSNERWKLHEEESFHDKIGDSNNNAPLKMIDKVNTSRGASNHRPSVTDHGVLTCGNTAATTTFPKGTAASVRSVLVGDTATLSPRSASETHRGLWMKPVLCRQRGSSCSPRRRTWSTHGRQPPLPRLRATRCRRHQTRPPRPGPRRLHLPQRAHLDHYLAPARRTDRQATGGLLTQLDPKPVRRTIDNSLENA